MPVKDRPHVYMLPELERWKKLIKRCSVASVEVRCPEGTQWKLGTFPMTGPYTIVSPLSNSLVVIESATHAHFVAKWHLVVHELV